MNVKLVILNLNELEGLKATIPKIDPEILATAFVIDGGSTDGSLDYLKELNLPVIGQSKRGRGEAMRLAFNHNKQDTDALIFFSPDGNEDTNDIIKFFPYLEEGYDVVIASRMMKESVNEEDGQILKLRKWANNAFNFAANTTWNKEKTYITDSINGFRAVTAKAFEKLCLDEDGFTIEYQMTIRAMKLGLSIKEFPTHEGQRIGGESGAKAIPTGLKFCNLYLKELRKGKIFAS